MEKSSKYFKKYIVYFVLMCTLLILTHNKVEAVSNIDVLNSLQNKIEKKADEIQELTRDIKKYQDELQNVAKEAGTLQSAIKSLDLTKSKLLKDIELTSNKVEATNLNLSKLDIEINETALSIDNNLEGLGETIRVLNDSESQSMIEVFLKYNDFGEAWEEVDTLESFQVRVKDKLNSLKLAKEILESKRFETEEKKVELEQLRSEYNAQNKIVVANKNQKEQLLKETKNTEAEYKKILERNLLRKAEFERELFEIESQLKILIDPSQIPTARQGILGWPLENIYITQYFGATVDAKRLYVSGTHNGVDFRASTGTRVLASAAGTISHVGNTDEVSGCYSFGRWALIKHENGLSSLYAHLSSLQVSVGQTVQRGQTIAFSGGAPGTPGAGYSTGPHLHFSVYVTEGVRPQNFQSSTPCNGAYMPLADQKAYLNPIDYLPSL